MRQFWLGLALGLVSCGGAGETQEDDSVAVIPASAMTFEAAANAAVEKLQPLGEEFAIVEMAARTQDAFQIDEASAVLVVQAFNSQSALEIDEGFDLVPMDAPQSALLRSETVPGYTMQAFRLAEVDAQRILAARRTLAEMKAEAPGQNELQLNAFVSGCLRDTENPPEELRLSVYLRIRPDADFFPFFTEQALPSAGPGFANAFWTPCEEKRDS